MGEKGLREKVKREKKKEKRETIKDMRMFRTFKKALCLQVNLSVQQVFRRCNAPIELFIRSNCYNSSLLESVIDLCVLIFFNPILFIEKQRPLFLNISFFFINQQMITLPHPLDDSTLLLSVLLLYMCYCSQNEYHEEERFINGDLKFF